MKRLVISSLVIFIFAAFIQVEMEEVKVNKRIKITLPKEFYRMSDQDIVKTYGMSRIPTAVYSNRERDINVSINEIKDTIAPEKKADSYEATKDYSKRSLKLEKEFMKSSLRAEYKDIEFLKDTIITKDGKDFTVLEFTGKIVGENRKGEEERSELYTYMQFTFHKQNKYVFNMSLPQDKMKEWKPIAHEVMNSVNLR